MRVRLTDQAVLDALEQRICLATFTVTSAADSGGGSLRSAIAAANVDTLPDRIVFAVAGGGGGGGARTITPLTALPAITGPVEIDGTTQPGYTGTPLIQIDGGALGAAANGLVVTGGDSTIKGLAVTRFGGAGIRLDSNKNLLLGNWIGVDPVAGAAAGNGQGVRVTGAKNTIGGGASFAETNVISGNLGAGVRVSGAGAAENNVFGNFIGVAFGGLAAIPNLYGVYLDGASDNAVGDPFAGGNVISGNSGAGVLIDGGARNVVRSSRIGTNLTGDAALPNGDAGVVLTNGTTGNTIGGVNLGDGNLISGNAGGGVLLTGLGTSNNSLFRNRIGLAEPATALALPNGNFGVGVRDGASANQVGGTLDGGANTISGNAGPGVRLFVQFGVAPSGNTIAGNRIGTDPAGTAARPNTFGVVGEGDDRTQIVGNQISGNTFDGVYLVGSTDAAVRNNRIGTTADGLAALGNARHGVHANARVDVGAAGPGGPNVISGNGGDGVVFSAATNNTIRNNHIGLDADGVNPIPNGGDGVELNNSFANVVGGDGPGEGNRISANGRNGVLIIGAASTANRVQGNVIGLNVGGVVRGNAQDGVRIDNAPLNLVGGASAAVMNVISGNERHGVELINPGATGNVVQGNRIGTDAAGAAARGNQLNGVVLYDGATQNRIGGDAPGAGNLISGNSLGVEVATAQNRVEGNRIGTDAAGLAPIPNLGGVVLFEGSGNVLGGTATATAGNLISGNVGPGVEIRGGGGGVLVVNNRIGTAADGLAPVPNGADGVLIDGTANNTLVGGTGPNAANVIAHNAGAGVRVRAGAGHAIFGNAIRDNGGLGIDLGGDGPTPNDPLDADTGPNNRQNAPTLTSVTSTTTTTTVAGTLHAAPGATFFVDFYATPSADPSGFGEGGRFLGTAVVTTDAAGNATFSWAIPGNVPTGHVITATATSSGATGDTSEFSAAIAVPDNVPPTVTAADFQHLLGPSHRVKVPFSEALAAPPAAADFVLTNRATGATHPVTSVNYDPALRVATVFFGGILPDANWRLTARAAGLADTSGNALDGNRDGVGGDDFTFDFFFLNGDANRDRRVDFTDLVVLAQNYESTGRTWAEGDFNYDTVVDFNDLVILAQRYETALPLPAAPASFGRAAHATTAASAAAPKFSNKVVRSLVERPVVAVKRPVAKPAAPRARR